MSAAKRSMSDLAYKVVPAWSRYVVSEIISYQPKLEKPAGNNPVPFSAGYSSLRIDSMRASYSKLSSSSMAVDQFVALFSKLLLSA